MKIFIRSKQFFTQILFVPVPPVAAADPPQRSSAAWIPEFTEERSRFTILDYSDWV